MTDNITDQDNTDQETAVVEATEAPVEASGPETEETEQVEAEVEDTEDKPKKKAGRPKKPEITVTPLLSSVETLPNDILRRPALPVYKSATDRVRAKVSDLRAKPVQIGSEIRLPLLFNGTELTVAEAEIDRVVDAVAEDWPIGGLLSKEPSYTTVFLGGTKAGVLTFLVGFKGNKAVLMKINKAEKRTYQAVTFAVLADEYNLDIQVNNVELIFWIHDLNKEQFNFPPKKEEKAKPAAKTAAKPTQPETEKAPKKRTVRARRTATPVAK